MAQIYDSYLLLNIKMNISADKNSISPLVILANLLKLHKLRVLFMVLVIMLIALSPSINAVLIKNIIDTATNYTGPVLIEKIFFWILAYVAWTESINITYRIYDWIYYKLMPKLKASVVDYFYQHIQEQSHAFFQNELAGNISNRIMETTKSLEYFVSTVNEKIIKKITGVTAAIVVIYSVNHIFAKIFIIWLVIFTIISFCFGPKIKTFSSNLAAKKSDVAGRLVDAISNISSIRMFSSYKYEAKYLNRYLERFIKSDVDMQAFLLKVRYLIGFIYSAMVFFMLYYLAQLRSESLLTVGDFVLILSICNDTADDIWELGEEMGDMLEDYGSFKQACGLLVSHIIQDDQLASKLRITQGSIEFRNVIFKYPGQDALFNDKSIFIPSKEKIGLVGYSGSGKTSFVNLITRFYDLDGGEILIDEQNIAKVTQQSLRDAISFIPQDPMLFNRNIMENIRYGKLDASDDEVFEAAKKAHIHDVIIDMPHRYDSMCGERGSKLSGGQKQRIAIARAVLKNSPILILDEATSALDSLTEKQIQESLALLMQNKTVLVIAHRLSTLLNMDRIIVFENGKIVENASHEELIQKKGLYYKFWNSQNEGFIR